GTAEARSPGLPQSPISQSQPARVLPQRPHAELWASGMEQASARRLRGVVAADFQRAHEIPQGADLGSFPASMFVPRWRLWLSRLLLALVMVLSFSIFSLRFSALASDWRIFFVYADWQLVRVFRSVLALGSPPVPRRILLLGRIYPLRLSL